MIFSFCFFEKTLITWDSELKHKLKPFDYPKWYECHSLGFVDIYMGF